MEFLHFGTSSEVLDHLAEDHKGRILRNQFSAIAGSMMCEVSPSACVIGCDVHPNVSVGEGSLVFSCTLVEGVRIGSRCVATGLTSQSAKFALPDRHCLWRVPVSIQTLQSAQVILCCGLDDDPKVPRASGGTFCGGQWGKFLRDRGIAERDLWGPNVKEQNLWDAKLFPAVRAQEQGLSFAMWLMGVSNINENSMLLGSWRSCQRLSLSDLHSHINFNELNHEVSEHIATLAGGFLKASILCGSLGRNFSQLCRSLALGRKETASKTLEESRSLLAELSKGQISVPASRLFQALTDISEASGDSRPASEARVWDAVAVETSAAVFKSHEIGQYSQTFFFFFAS